MAMVGDVVAELGPEHADGTIWADISGDIWQPGPYGEWMVLRQMPFVVIGLVARPSAVHGPYRAVLGPPTGGEA